MPNTKTVVLVEQLEDDEGATAMHTVPAPRPGAERGGGHILVRKRDQQSDFINGRASIPWDQ